MANGLPILKFVKSWFRNNFVEEKHWDELVNKIQPWASTVRKNFIQLGLDIGGSSYQYNGNGAKTQTTDILTRISNLEDTSEQNTIKLINNVAINLSAGVFSLLGADLNIFSPTNKGTLNVQTAGGFLNSVSLESDVYKFNDATTASSDIVNENFGTVSGVAATTNVTFWGYIVYDTANNDGQIAICRIPHLRQSPASSNNLAYNGNPATTNSINNFFFLTPTNIKSTHNNMPCQQIFQLKMTKSSGDDWTVTSLSATDVTGSEELSNQFHSSDNAGASSESYTLYRNSPSPANSDDLYDLVYKGNNDAGQAVDYARIRSSIGDITDGSEDGALDLRVIRAGTEVSAFNIAGSTSTIVFGSNFDVALATTKRLYFDGGTDDYIYQSASTNIDFVQGGTNSFRIQSGFVEVRNGADIIIGATSKLRLDGASGGDTFITEAASDQMDFNVGGTARLSIKTTGLDCLASDIFLGAGQAIYFDGTSGNDRIYQSAANNIDFVAGGTTSFRIQSGFAEMRSGADFIIGFGSFLRLDGASGGDTYIHSSVADRIDIVCGGTAVAAFVEATNDSLSLPTTTRLEFDGVGGNIFFDVSSSRLQLNNSGNSGSPITGMIASVTNAGAGGCIGIDFTGMSGAGTEWIFQAPADATDPTGGGGAATGRIPIRVGGATVYLPYY